MTEIEQTLRQRFTAFLQAMYDWETEANRVDEEEASTFPQRPRPRC